MNPAPAAENRQIRWQSPVFDPSGYADEARYLLRNVHQHVPIRLESIGRVSKKFHAEMDPSEREILQKLIATPLANDHLQLTIAPAYAFRRDPAARYAIGRTTFETDRLHPDWVAACNRLDEIWVPTAFNVETFQRAGVTVPVHIVPQGVDAARFHPGLKPLEISGRRHFAFLAIFEWIHRKGWDILLRAWAETFSPDEDVCLCLRSYLPNLTEGKSSTDAINERIDDFLNRELGKKRTEVAPIIVLGEQFAQLDMPRLYASADAFVLPTRGEGWGRPYIEAMACGLPVIGTRWGAQLAFMHDGNSFLNDIEGLETVDARMEFPFYHGHQWARPSGTHLKKLLRHVTDNRVAAKEIGAAAAVEMREKWHWENAAKILRTRLAEIAVEKFSGKSKPPTAVSWLGSFLDHGSLSHVNRELTGALKSFPEFQLNRVNTGAIAPFGFENLVRELSAATPLNAAVTIRHAWPPDWQRPARGKLVVIQPWEFGALPGDWIPRAQNVDEFWVPSNFVRNCYLESGVPAQKVIVVPNGVDAEKFHPQVAPMKLATQKKIKFLFVGGTIGRKGPDLLLQAYLKNFTAADDVCLVIKDFGGKSFYAGQTFESQIRAAQALPNAPEILYLNEELPPDSLPGLYTACDCFVLPYRGEGFGLPVLEAMACGRPVIVTAGGATDDFVRGEFADRIPAKRKFIGPEVGGLKLSGAGWLLEPDLAALGEQMRRVFSKPGEARARGQLASRFAHEFFAWKNSATIIAQRLRALVANAGEIIRTSAQKNESVQLPPAADLGRLNAARQLFGQRKFQAAWETTLAAIAQRPFHPEAFLLLGEIALAAGDSATARQAVQRAREWAPHWPAPKQFLKKPLKGRAQWEWLKLPSIFSFQPATFKPILSVCLIVKNEEKFLAQCLRSVRGLAEQIVVVDTGSTDRTLEIAREFKAEIHSFAWTDDFAAARNVALEHATGDWILMLDADEELPAAQHAALIADLQKSDLLACRLPLVNRGHEAQGRSFVPRLFRNAPGIFYTGRIHEQIFPSLIADAKTWGLKLGFGTAELLHHGYTKELMRDRNKIERNLNLLHRAVAENPADANLMMNLGLELIRSEDLAGGIEKYRAAFQLLSAQAPDEVAPELREVLLTQFTSHLYKIRAHDEIVRVFNSPLAKNGGLMASHHFALGLAQFELQQFAAATAAMRLCIAQRGQPVFSPINTDILTAAPNHCLALSLAKMGDIAGAEKTFKIALTEPGQTVVIKLDHAKFLAAQNRPVEAFQALHELVGANPGLVAAWRLGGEIALTRADFLEFARDWTGEAMRHVPENFAITRQRAEVLLLSNDVMAAAELWGWLGRSERQPDILAALILCETIAGQTLPASEKNFDEAATSRAFIKWYQRLIAMRAHAVVHKINEQLAALSVLLPTAAAMLGKALAEPQSH